MKNAVAGRVVCSLRLVVVDESRLTVESVGQSKQGGPLSQQPSKYLGCMCYAVLCTGHTKPPLRRDDDKLCYLVWN